MQGKVRKFYWSGVFFTGHLYPRDLALMDTASLERPARAGNLVLTQRRQPEAFIVRTDMTRCGALTHWIGTRMLMLCGAAIGEITTVMAAIAP